MAAAKEAKDPTVTPVRSAGLTAIVGTLDEKVRAFQQMGSAASSGLFPAGYDTVQKIQAACWFGDGLGVHPTIYMEGVQPVQFGGKTMREPKWEFVNALLRSRLPGFDFTVHEETERACEIEFFATGRKPQRVRYTMEMAVKQGLAGPNGRNRDGYEKNAIKMLWKQCFKMGADRIGADALAGLLAMAHESANAEIALQPTPAEAIDKAIEKATAPIDVQFEEGETVREPHSGATVESPRVRLNALIVERYGKLSREATAAKVSELYGEMIGTDMKDVKLGPVEAEQLIEYIEKGAGGIKTANAEVGGLPVNPADATSFAGALPQEDAAPEPEPVPVSVSEQQREVRTPQSAYDELWVTVRRAQKLFKRTFITEAPPQSGVFWFIDMATFKQAGDQEVIKLQKDGVVIAPVEKIEQLNRILAADCDKRERGRP